MKPYRKNVGIVVFNSKGLVLVGERANYKGAWQFPQGGMDEGEEPIDAAKRELYEEVGVGDAEFIFEFPDWLNYDFPPNIQNKNLKKYQGQTQKWFLAFWDHPLEKCNLDIHEREFERINFISLDTILETIVEFKKPVYKAIQLVFALEIKKFLDKK